MMTLIREWRRVYGSAFAAWTAAVVSVTAIIMALLMPGH